MQKILIAQIGKLILTPKSRYGISRAGLYLIEETDFDSLQELEDELLKYLVYYNWQRPHQGINGKKPIEMTTLNNK